MALQLYCVTCVDINKHMLVNKMPQIEEVLWSQFYWGKNQEHAIKQAFSDSGLPTKVVHEEGTLYSVNESAGEHLGYCRVEVIAITPSQKKRMKAQGMV
jgi:hypothetical protein